MDNNIINPMTSEERKSLFLEVVINESMNEDGSSRISKVSPHSAFSGVASGVAALSEMSEKDIALSLSYILPEMGSGDQLDRIAKNHGIRPRLGAIGSSTYIRISANPFTQYLANVHFFYSNNVKFALEKDVVVGRVGFVYAKVQSMSVGSATNVDPLTINDVNPKPSGHQSVLNEYIASGGRDIESDKEYKASFKDYINKMSRNTLSSLEQIMISVNPNVLGLIQKGRSKNGNLKLGVVASNGANFTESQLNELLESVKYNLCLSDYKRLGANYKGVSLENIEYVPIDIMYRADIEENADIEKIRKESQINVSKYLDLRFFNPEKQFVEWDKLLQICQSIDKVRYIPDQYFYPRQDLRIDTRFRPRVRSFLILNLKGEVISDWRGDLSPIYYPNTVDKDYINTIKQNDN